MSYGKTGPISAPTVRKDDLIGLVPTPSLSDMALQAARTICPSPPRSHAPDQIIVCTTSFEHDLALSCAGRLHSELRSARPPFAIGQLQDVSFLTAVDIALAMMHSDAALTTVLIVAAEGWHRCFSEQLAPRTALADGAAATLIARSPISGWRVRALSICTAATQLAHNDVPISTSTVTLVEAINKSLSRAALRAAQIDWIVPSTNDGEMVSAVCARCKLMPERIWGTDDTQRSHLCAAQTPARLGQLMRAISPREGQRALVWSTGYQGQAACAILEYRSA